MNRVRLGTKLRAIRLRRRLRQADVARMARTSASSVSRIEDGKVVSFPIVERVAVALGAELDVDVRWHGGELDRAINRAHNRLTEEIVAWMEAQPGWHATAEVSFAVEREHGVVDIVGWHDVCRHVAIIEVKTGLFDVNEHLGTLHRKARLARRIAAEIGVCPDLVSVWLIVADSKTNRRRLSEHRALVASQLPADGRALRGWFRVPDHEIRGVAFWSKLPLGNTGPEQTSTRRVRRLNRGRDAR